MPSLVRAALGTCFLLAAAVQAQTPAVLRDLDAQGRVTLTAEELQKLIPNAKMSRVTAKGNTHYWRNEPGGSFVVSSDNRATQSRNSTAQGKWHLSDDGRYCVLFEWKTVETEEWCRYIVKSGDAYYATKSEKNGTEKVYKLEIGN
ncbi:hypothetical protein os1_29360 [Comamonadaceae bacterium OS-1]|nr:hypothetical protein os1_29360 [Comamonadaceae bacterium OS-1]